MIRTILISGANRGIGRSIAERALKEGHRLSIGVRNPKDLKGSNLDPKISGADKVLLNYYDANDINSATEWVNSTLKHFRNIDSLINCAGIFNRTSFLFDEQDRSSIDDLWKVNVMGPWQLTREAWYPISKSGQGRVIFLVSMSGKRSKGKLAGYTTSKFALMGLCQTIRNEGWDKGIRVTAICPSWVNTDMASGISTLPKEEMTQPEDIASISSELLRLPNSCIPFELKINCNLET